MVMTSERRNNKIKDSLRERLFHLFVVVFVFLAALTCLYPILNIAAISFSDNNAILSGKVGLIPVGFQTSAYQAVFTDSSMIRSLCFTVILTVSSAAFSVLMTMLAAYPLSKKRLFGRNVFLPVIMFTMYFTGGMIPTYLVVKQLNLIDTVWALLLPGAISTYNMIIMKTFFTNIPESLEESACIDGANEIVILFRIVLPLSMPIIATMILFYAVTRWNAYMDALLYINKVELYPLQLKLRQLITSASSLDQVINDMAGVPEQALIPETVKSASLIFATLPILLVYPWLQKYFVKGVMIGSVKG